MKQKRTNKQKTVAFQGFTLVESLISLLVIVAFLLLPALSLQGWQQKSSEELFFTSFEKNLSATQQAAITRNRTTYVRYLGHSFVFTGTRYADANNVELLIPEGITCQSPASIAFTTRSGNYTGMEKLTFKLPHRGIEIAYQFQMGSGKYTKTITNKK